MTPDRDIVIKELLATAMRCAADVARGRVGRDLVVTDASLPTSSALLRFDLRFDDGEVLSWFVSNEDATGFSDILIGGTGDRAAVLTEMHLDALSGVFSDMLERAVDGINASLTLPLRGGSVDMGMEGAVPSPDTGGERLVTALDIEGFGPLVIVTQTNADMADTLVARAAPDSPALAAAIRAAEPEEIAAPEPVAAPDPVAAAPLADDMPEPTPHVETTSGEQEQVSTPAPSAAPTTTDNVVPLPTFAEREAQPAKGDIRRLLNVPLPVTVELGRTRQTIGELLELNVGSILELEKLAGDPMDIMVNGRVLARGEVVVMDEEFGIRITEILSPEDRLKKLG